MPDKKSSIGSAIVEVFDASVALAKAEINSLVGQFTEIAKVKGIGVVLLLAALAPLTLFLIFFILAIFFLLSLFMPLWGSALVIAIVGLITTLILVSMGLNKLKTEVKQEETSLTESQRLEAEYWARQNQTKNSTSQKTSPSEQYGRHGSLTSQTNHTPLQNKVETKKLDTNEPKRLEGAEIPISTQPTRKED